MVLRKIKPQKKSASCGSRFANSLCLSWDTFLFSNYLIYKVCVLKFPLFYTLLLHIFMFLRPQKKPKKLRNEKKYKYLFFNVLGFKKNFFCRVERQKSPPRPTSCGNFRAVLQGNMTRGHLLIFAAAKKKKKTKKIFFAKLVTTLLQTVFLKPQTAD